MIRQEQEQAMSYTENYTRGLSLYHRGLYEQALEELGPLAEQDSLAGRLAKYYQAMCHRGAGLAALREGRFSVAERHLRSAVASIGPSADLTNYLASLYAGAGQCQRCADEMEKAADMEPHSAEAWRKRALAQWRAGRRPQAYMTLTEALRKLGGHSQLHLQLGLFHAAEEHYDEASRSLALAVEADCTSAEAHYYLALAAAARNDVRAAVRSFQRAHELRPHDLMLAYQLALAAKAAGETGFQVVLRLPEPLAQATGSQIRQLARYLCREADFVDAFVELPPCEVDRELFALLAGVLQMAIDEHPGYADLHYHCSRVFHRLGRTETALEYARRALAINPRYVKALVHAARLEAQVGLNAQAIEHLERAIACGGDWADVHCLAGELMGRADLPGGAREHLRRALELNAEYHRAADALASLAA